MKFFYPNTLMHGIQKRHVTFLDMYLHVLGAFGSSYTISYVVVPEGSKVILLLKTVFHK
jgi:hypothetical protein